MRDHYLREKVGDIEALLERLFERCYYCGKLARKTYKAEEHLATYHDYSSPGKKVVHFSPPLVGKSVVGFYACEKCIEGFKEKCKLAQTVKKEKYKGGET